jgi:multicomponent Na+:H+ antiporter subunit C
MLKKSLVRLIIGIILLGHATNLFLLIIGRATKGIPAFIKEGSAIPEAGFADPLPQALILTAIVIGFGIQAFAIILLKRIYQTTGTSNLDELNNTDQIETDIR